MILFCPHVCMCVCMHIHMHMYTYICVYICVEAWGLPWVSSSEWHLLLLTQRLSFAWISLLRLDLMVSESQAFWSLSSRHWDYKCVYQCALLFMLILGLNSGSSVWKTSALLMKLSTQILLFSSSILQTVIKKKTQSYIIIENFWK